jgi:hypothetical protein
VYGGNKDRQGEAGASVTHQLKPAAGMEFNTACVKGIESLNLNVAVLAYY